MLQSFTPYPEKIRQQMMILALISMTNSAFAAPFLLPEQFDVDARTTSITVQSGLTGDSFFVPNRNFKTEFSITTPDGQSKIVPANVELKKFSLIETDVSQSGTYLIQTVNTLVIPTRYVLSDGQWLRVVPTRPPMAGMKDMPKKEGGDKPGADKGDIAKATPAKATSIGEDKLPAGAQLFTSNALNKAVTYVTKGIPAPLAAFTNKGFEVRPVTHPSEAYVTDGFEFEARFDGKPAAGLTFSVARGVSQYDKEGKRERPDVVTDQQGHGKVTFDLPGVYLISTTYPALMSDRSVQPPAQTVNFGLTIEVAP
ncbi:DUF4198 domain-containing protein [Aquirhabdus parva]|uniref:DUF4198 domain-containing protein n=1 Tax=Aquirhabdus parva TaxID=2283318 RepID=A0A345P2M1_9GAMM|nr:DUF4198 domain-containing protein [Aquirhabdus parva]AXI01530.1 DUF4198 domain-containing protein [Aquirhabdus parva]